MKKLIIIVIVFAFSFSHAQISKERFVSNSINSFMDGEWLQFRVHYGFFNASEIEIELKKKKLNGVSVFHAKGYGRSTGLLRFFFKVEDYYESFFKESNGLPIWFIRDIYEGGYTKNLEMFFNHDLNTVKLNDKKKNRVLNFDINSNAQDLISAFYYLRNFYNTDNLEIGEEISINMFFDEENYLFKLKFLGYDILNTKFGYVDCIKFRPYVQSGRVFKEQESVTLWISNDKNKIPVKMKADLKIGAIECDLENFKNLNYQLLTFLINHYSHLKKCLKTSRNLFLYERLPFQHNITFFCFNSSLL